MMKRRQVILVLFLSQHTASALSTLKFRVNRLVEHGDFEWRTQEATLNFRIDRALGRLLFTPEALQRLAGG
jgi:hypothetical protein